MKPYPLVALLLLCFASITFSDSIDEQLRYTPLETVTHSYKSLGVDRELLVEVSQATGAVRDSAASPNIDFSKFKIGKKRQRVDRIDWQTVQATLYEHLNPKQEETHRQYCFQYLIGIGLPQAALRYAGVKFKDSKKITNERNALEAKLRERHKTDRENIRAHCLRSFVDPKELKAAVGKPFDIGNKGLKEYHDSDPGMPSMRHMQIATLPAVGIHLKMTIKTRKELTNLKAKWIKEIGLVEFPGFEEGEVTYELGKEIEQPLETEKEIAKSIEDILSAEQFQRLRQIYVRNLVTVDDMKRVAAEFGLTYKGEFRTAVAGLGRQMHLAKHLRAFELYSPIVKSRMKASEFRELTKKQFVPHDPFGVSASTAASVFADFGVRETKRSNPRRER